MYRSLKVLDGGVGVFCGSGGVEPQSETNWRYANESEVSRIIFVNKLDRLGADFYRVVKQVEEVLGANPLVMTLPIGTEDNFVGVVDLLTRKAWVWDDSGDPTNYKIEEPPADMADKVEEYREKLIETALEQDDELLMMYLEGEEPELDDIKRCVRKGTIALDFFPTYCGSAFKNKGIQLVLDAVVDYLPNPTEVEPQPEVDLEGNETGEVATSRSGAAAARAGVQDHGRSFRRIDVYPDLLGHAGQGRHRAEHFSPAKPSASAGSSRCTRTIVSNWTRPRRATSSRWSA